VTAGATHSGFGSPICLNSYSSGQVWWGRQGDISSDIHPFPVTFEERSDPLDPAAEWAVWILGSWSTPLATFTKLCPFLVLCSTRVGFGSVLCSTSFLFGFEVPWSTFFSTGVGVLFSILHSAEGMHFGTTFQPRLRVLCSTFAFTGLQVLFSACHSLLEVPLGTSSLLGSEVLCSTFPPLVFKCFSAPVTVSGKCLSALPPFLALECFAALLPTLFFKCISALVTVESEML
jgi:hypothetical protein